MVFTHLSVRVPGADDHFLLNPFGYLLFEVTAAGFTIHSAVHMSGPDAHAVLHLHTNQGIAVASSKETLLSR